MPTYEYYCAANETSVEVVHSMSDSIASWGDLCERVGRPLGDTPSEAPVERIIFAAALSMPHGNSKLKEMGFTKLVRRDQGVYENVTATGDEKRYMKSDDPTSVPHIQKKIGD